MPAKYESKKSRLIRRCCCSTLQLGCLFIAACCIAACIASIFYSIIMLLEGEDSNSARQMCWALKREGAEFIKRMAERAQASYERICTEALADHFANETTPRTPLPWWKTINDTAPGGTATTKGGVPPAGTPKPVTTKAPIKTTRKPNRRRAIPDGTVSEKRPGNQASTNIRPTVGSIGISVPQTAVSVTKKSKREIPSSGHRTSGEMNNVVSRTQHRKPIPSPVQHHNMEQNAEPAFDQNEDYIFVQNQFEVETGGIRVKRRYNPWNMSYTCVLKAEEAKRYAYIYYWESLQDIKKGVCKSAETFYRDLDIVNIVVSTIWLIIAMVLIFGVVFSNHWMLLVWLATFWFYVIFELVYFYFRVMLMLKIYWHSSDAWLALTIVLLIVIIAICILKFYVIFCYWWFVFTPAFMLMSNLNNMQLIVSRRG